MIKIKFPSPSDLSNKDWFEQMELSLFHAKKAYQKFIEGMPEENRKDVGIWFEYPEMKKNKEFQELLDSEKLSYDDSQEIELIINY